jgi:hypothetical protein
MELENKRNQKIPGSLSSPGNLKKNFFFNLCEMHFGDAAMKAIICCFCCCVQEMGSTIFWMINLQSADGAAAELG